VTAAVVKGRRALLHPTHLRNDSLPISRERTGGNAVRIVIHSLTKRKTKRKTKAMSLHFPRCCAPRSVIVVPGWSGHGACEGQQLKTSSPRVFKTQTNNLSKSRKSYKGNSVEKVTFKIFSGFFVHKVYIVVHGLLYWETNPPALLSFVFCRRCTRKPSFVIM